MRILPLVAALLAGCGTPPIPEPDPTPGPDPFDDPRFILGPEVTCDDPVDGFARLVPADPERGLDVEISFQSPPGGNISSTVVMHDMDVDGDIDLVLNDFNFPPRIFENDSTGHFSEVPNFPDFHMQMNLSTALAGHAAADMDGDAVPDLLLLGDSLVIWQRGLGDLLFEEPEVLYRAFEHGALYGTLALGDVDGDEDLDIVLPGLCDFGDGGPGGGGPQPSRDVLLINNDGVFELAFVLDLYDKLSLAIVSAVTDRDFDGDFDILLPTDLGSFSAEDLAVTGFFRNDGLRDDGLPDLVNDAPELSADIRISAMGIVNGDLNGDGALDYCITDTGPIRCLMSDPSGYVDTSAPLGLVPDAAENPGAWSGWGIELRDFDHDGIQDVAAAGGLPIGSQGNLSEEHPDTIWRGTDEGTFVDESASMDFGHLVQHYGMASGDLDGDGFLEIVTAGSGEVVTWWNRCGSGAWTIIDFEGPAPNHEAFGARIELHAGGRRYIEELWAIRGLGQGPSSMHHGLGDVDRIDSLIVTWPDGAITEAVDLPVNRTVRAVHPSLVE